MSSERTVTFLKWASAIVIGFGLLVFLGARPETSGPVGFMADLVFWPVDGAQDVNAPEMRLFSAVSGGMLAGWGLLLWQVSTQLYPREPELARRMILSSIGVWFIIDSTGSILAGAPLNAVLNIGFLLAFVIPLRRSTATARA